MTGDNSSPDHSLSGRIWFTKIFWAVLEPIDNSNHIPSLINFHHIVCKQPVLLQSSKWRQNGVDWENFSKVVNDWMVDRASKDKLLEFLSDFTDILNADQNFT